MGDFVGSHPVLFWSSILIIAAGLAAVYLTRAFRSLQASPPVGRESENPLEQQNASLSAVILFALVGGMAVLGMLIAGLLPIVNVAVWLRIGGLVGGAFGFFVFGRLMKRSPQQQGKPGIPKDEA